MNVQYLPSVVIVAAVVAFIIYRQLMRRPVEGRQLVVLPLALAVLGLYNLGKQLPATSAAVVALVASLAIAVVFGVARGLSTRVWRDGGSVLRQGTPVTAALWVVAIALRVGVGALAHRAGVAQSITFGELPLFLGVTLAAQNLVIWMRAQASAVTSFARSQSVD